MRKFFRWAGLKTRHAVRRIGARSGAEREWLKRRARVSDEPRFVWVITREGASDLAVAKRAELGELAERERAELVRVQSNVHERAVQL